MPVMLSCANIPPDMIWRTAYSTVTLHVANPMRPELIKRRHEVIAVTASERLPVQLARRTKAA
jgi:hypothetical protein